jgi:hypothetical protein
MIEVVWCCEVVSVFVGILPIWDYFPYAADVPALSPHTNQALSSDFVLLAQLVLGELHPHDWVTCPVLPEFRNVADAHKALVTAQRDPYAAK